MKKNTPKSLLIALLLGTIFQGSILAMDDNQLAQQPEGQSTWLLRTAHELDDNARQFMTRYVLSESRSVQPPNNLTNQDLQPAQQMDQNQLTQQPDGQSTWLLRTARELDHNVCQFMRRYVLSESRSFQLPNNQDLQPAHQDDEAAQQDDADQQNPIDAFHDMDVEQRRIAQNNYLAHIRAQTRNTLLAIVQSNIYQNAARASIATPARLALTTGAVSFLTGYARYRIGTAINTMDPLSGILLPRETPREAISLSLLLRTAIAIPSLYMVYSGSNEMINAPFETYSLHTILAAHPEVFQLRQPQQPMQPMDQNQLTQQSEGQSTWLLRTARELDHNVCQFMRRYVLSESRSFQLPNNQDLQPAHQDDEAAQQDDADQQNPIDAFHDMDVEQRRIAQNNYLAHIRAQTRNTLLAIVQSNIYQNAARASIATPARLALTTGAVSFLTGYARYRIGTAINTMDPLSGILLPRETPREAISLSLLLRTARAICSLYMRYSGAIDMTLVPFDTYCLYTTLAAHPEWFQPLQPPQPMQPIPVPENIQEAVCSVCLEDVLAHTGSQLSCNHIYHTECLQTWFQQCNAMRKTPHCPICRRNVITPNTTNQNQA